jgi:hypothetical protein
MRPLKPAVINVKNQILNKILAVIFTLVGTMWIFLAALNRGNNSLGIETFSKKNIIITGLFFVVVGPIIYFISKWKKNKKAD